MNAYRSLAKIFAACMLAAGIAACSSSGSGNHSKSTPPSTTSAPASTSSPAASGTAAIITRNWVTFFNGKTPVAKRVSLLQDGAQFPHSALAASALSAGATAKVLSVSNITPNSATVKYNILLDGTPALKNQVGTAILQAGTWKVGVTSFCSLLTLENAGKTKGLPAVCKTAS